jgi:LmbE family N-acetylglucosaminyl deacetylase
MCRGDKGQPSSKIANLTAVRQKEMRASAQLLGARLFLGEQADGELADSNRTRLKLIEIYRQFKPTLVLAHSPEDYHPDHRAAGCLAEAVSWFCASQGHRTRSAAIPAPPALWWMDTLSMAGFVPGFFIDITEFLGLKARMLACHETQLRRGKDSDFSPLAELMRLQFRTRGMQEWTRRRHFGRTPRSSGHVLGEGEI